MPSTTIVLPDEDPVADVREPVKAPMDGKPLTPWVHHSGERGDGRA